MKLYRNEILVGEGQTARECFESAREKGHKTGPFVVEAFISKKLSVFKEWRMETGNGIPLHKETKKAKKASVLSSPLPSEEDIEEDDGTDEEETISLEEIEEEE